ncbi:MAG: AsnC family transcriptional regulator [Desulfovermiculus sp.]
MDKTDKHILDIIQTDFPLVSRPYAQIGDQVGLTQGEALARVRAMQHRGIIRRIGANFQSRRLGWKSTLCAAAVPEDKLDEFISFVNSYPGVTHNYLRRHTYNVWFTFIGPSWQDIEDSLAEITKETGVKVLNLPAERMFKIRVDFRMQEE